MVFFTYLHKRHNVTNALKICQIDKSFTYKVNTHQRKKRNYCVPVDKTVMVKHKQLFVLNNIYLLKWASA